MKVVMVTSALSLRSGSPRQRQTAALRDALSRHATVVQITVDCWHSEWPDRARMRRGDRLFAPMAPAMKRNHRVSARRTMGAAASATAAP